MWPTEKSLLAAKVAKVLTAASVGALLALGVLPPEAAHKLCGSFWNPPQLALNPLSASSLPE